MKHIRLLLLVAVSMLSSSLAFAQQLAQAYLLRALPASLHSTVQLPSRTPWHTRQAVQAQTTVYRPGQSVMYQWDEETKKWSDAKQTTFTYDAKARPEQIVYADSVTKVLEMRQTYSYDNQGRPAVLKMEAWTGTAWSNASQLRYEFDAQGDLKTFFLESWVANAWVPVIGIRYTITRNAAGLRQEVMEEDLQPDGTYAKASREVYTISNNRYSEVMYQDWDGSKWVNTTRERNFAWADWATLTPSSYEEQEWKNNAWQDVVRYVYTYTANGSSTETLQVRENNAWVNDTRESFLYDNLGNDVGHRMEIWQGTAWDVDSETRIVHYFGANNRILRSVEQDLDLNTNTYQNSSRTNHSNFQAFVITASRASVRENQGTLYPNPATNAATLELPALRQAGLVRTEILNSVGQVLRTTTVRTQPGVTRVTLELSGLPAGTYLVRAHTPEGLVTKPLLHR
ncbi:T9SS type A sorting domain-containing protein [Hymenobacter sp. BT18]|uniref:T9SS type A sorting domain-containing protein n=1 Tax=Hymenobacter sp. BT18 TaxID=2835648 RepID=UPI00143EEEC0|nr:T9SS type A sorting domain-containing protein [Hymenobacter sp. BT18]QIX62356.1 T9SS type A sorting domain-containing protein [Hymenobacter sp. BT18]